VFQFRVVTRVEPRSSTSLLGLPVRPSTSHVAPKASRSPSRKTSQSPRLERIGSGGNGRLTDGLIPEHVAVFVEDH